MRAIVDQVSRQSVESIDPAGRVKGTIVQAINLQVWAGVTQGGGAEAGSVGQG